MEESVQSISLRQYFTPLTTLKAMHIICIVGIIVYFNSLFNNFVWDDYSYLLNNPQIHVFNLGTIFGPSLFNATDIGYYRPVTALYFTITYLFFQNNPLPYHLIQLSLHIICACLVYILFTRFISKNLSLLLSLIFLVHPFQVESVALITSTDSELFFVFGIIALFLSQKRDVAIKRTLSIFILLLLSCLTKETGVLFIGVIILYRLFFQRKQVKTFIFYSFMTIVVYAFIRFVIGHVYLAQGSPKVIMVHTPFIIRLLNIPAIMYFYIRTFIFPTQMVIDQQWVITHATFSSFYFPLLLIIGFFIGCILLSHFLYRKHRKAFLPFMFFFLWFLGGMSLVVQIFPLDMTVGDRWFYFPIVGLLGMVGIGLQTLRTTRLYTNSIIPGLMLIICVFSVLTFLRNENWHDEITLFEHDIPILKQRDSTLSVGQLENDLSAYLLQANQVDKAEYYALDSLHYDPIPNRYNTVGMMYQIKGDYRQSAYWYQRAIAASNLEKAYENYSILLLQEKKNTDAVRVIKKALGYYPKDSTLWESLAFAQFFLNDKSAALDSAREAYALNDNQSSEYVFQRLVKNQPIAL